MVFFVLSVLSALIAAFLIMTAVQLIRIERVIEACADIADIKVKKLYGKR
ncbi:MAG: hypothetical protein JXA18_03985 [Chitinispirillaceae bacterium]|nr:hypothetical protein [Chitinispirillaceae bacterium]